MIRVLIAERGMKSTSMRSIWLTVAMTITVVLWGVPALAEVKVFEADYTYRMGDNDSKVDARRVAVQEAKRKALQLAGAYVETLTQVTSLRLTRDEVRAYTAGVARSEIIADETRGSAQRPEISIRTRCTVDPDDLQEALNRYRENEELEDQLEASIRENDQLKKERDRLLKQLAAEKDQAKAEQARQKLGNVLDREESNDETHRFWTALAYDLSDCTETEPELGQDELAGYSAGLEKAIAIDPKNQRAHYLLAALYQKKGDVKAAEREVRTAVQRNPSNPVLHLKLGILLRARGSNDEALKEFHFVERLRPRNTVMLYYTGVTLRDLKRCGLSVLYLQRFLKDRKAIRFPKKREDAARTIDDCGGARGSYQRRIKHP